jgi:chromate reductase
VTRSYSILGISGSLRADSYNTRLLHAAVGLAPSGMQIEIYKELEMIPPYNEDNDVSDAPGPVADLRARIHAADALLIVTPEFNYGIPGVLKNALDWASTSAGDEPPSLAAKPVAIMGAAPTNFGSVRAQLALRQVFVWTDSRPVVKPEVIVFRAHERFDGSHLTDEGTAALVTSLLVELERKVDAERLVSDLPR